MVDQAIGFLWVEETSTSSQLVVKNSAFSKIKEQVFEERNARRRDIFSKYGNVLLSVPILS
jgi:hypothetical protein